MLGSTLVTWAVLWLLLSPLLLLWLNFPSLSAALVILSLARGVRWLLAPVEVDTLFWLSE